MSKIKFYETGDGQKVTIPEDAHIELFDVLRENLSPGAVAAVVSLLPIAKTNSENVNREILWLRDYLLENLGLNNFDDMIDELGL